MSVVRPRFKTLFRILACLAVLFVSLVLLGVTKPLDHDEHQFVAAGALLARRGLLPYRDYPYFHMPNLVFVDAVLFRFSDHLLLAARAVSILCGFATAAVLSGVAGRLFAPLGRRAAWFAAILAASVLITQPIFASTSGRAWNHDVPVLLTLLAFLAALRASSPTATSPPKSWTTRALWQMCAGALLGAAIGTRLTFAPAFLALAVIVGARSGSIRQRLAGVIRFTAAVAIALAPSLWLFAVAPAQFTFGNFLYPALNTAFRRETGYPKAMTAIGKVLYIFTDILTRPATLVMFLALAGSLTALVVSRIRNQRMSNPDPPHPHRFAIAALLLLIACLLVGTFAPTPTFPVYFYAPLPFAILLILFIAAPTEHGQMLPAIGRLHRRLVYFGIAATAIGLVGYEQVRHPADLAQWTPLDVHRIGQSLFRDCASQRILTLAPIFPLEGGADIYEALATGPFAMRAGARLNESNERLYKLMDEDDLPELFDRHPPAGVLTGLERGQDDPIAIIARNHGYVDRSKFTYRRKGLVLQTPALSTTLVDQRASGVIQRSTSGNEMPLSGTSADQETLGRNPSKP
ncbi:MAG: hypothetical protein JWN40_1388 [Phycisphaerales bacterium]|nr:hypothetical protein [Phycisphaerales bacterium]